MKETPAVPKPLKDLQTLCVHGAKDLNNSTRAVSVPIYQSATFAHPGVGQSAGYDYSRLQNPTREALEKTVAALEGGADAMAFSSGMAAMVVLMELFGPGDEIIASRDLYGGSVRLFDNVLKKNGVSVTYLHTGDIDAVRKRTGARTKAIFVETPTNPLMHVTDIRAVSGFAKENGILLIVDNTFLTPYFQQPILQGADAVIHSGTKYLGGHNDTLAGFLVVASNELSEKLRFLYKTVGACLPPFDAFLLLRGIKTLAIRMERHQRNAMEIARWLEKQPKVEKVYYVGLPAHPDYALSCGQTSGFGGMISFETDSEETARRILQNVKIIMFAESLGGVESLITYPILQTHADVPEEVRNQLGIHNRLLRLSVGIEDAGDLIADLEQAMGKPWGSAPYVRT
ncbi:MAG: PLP-dependent aspartate aminotransferase family protein [Clostridiales bacterium]|jgi:cystathionine gamma-synthase|nr:PLP-dependent aspartate aminotransferase family protein [Clostridiales bacterium]